MYVCNESKSEFEARNKVYILPKWFENGFC